MKTLGSLVLFGMLPLLAAGEPSNETFGLENGRVWNTLTPDWKGACLMGMVQGWKLRANTEESTLVRVANAFSASGKFNTNDLADMVTSVYADTENIALPIGWVVLASLAIERGETSRNTVLVALRKQMTKLLSGKGSLPNTDFDPIATIAASRVP